MVAQNVTLAHKLVNQLHYTSALLSNFRTNNCWPTSAAVTSKGIHMLPANKNGYNSWLEPTTTDLCSCLYFTKYSVHFKQTCSFVSCILHFYFQGWGEETSMRHKMYRLEYFI